MAYEDCQVLKDLCNQVFGICVVIFKQLQTKLRGSYWWIAHGYGDVITLSFFYSSSTNQRALVCKPFA